MIRLVPALAACLCGAACGRLDFAATATDGGSASDSDAGSRAHDFPRLATMSSSNSQDYDDEGFRIRAATKSFVIISYYAGWETSRTMTLEEVVTDIHARSTIGTKVIVYINDYDELPISDMGDDREGPLHDKIAAEGWWLYDTGSSGTIVRAPFDAGQGLINYSSNAPADANGKHYADINAEYHYKLTILGNNQNHAAPSIDGFFVSNLSSHVPNVGDWDRDGTTDNNPGSQALRDSLRAGAAAYAPAMRAFAPDKLMLGGQYAWDEDAGALEQAYEGGVWGDIIGEEGTGFENRNGFDAMMTQYRQSMAHAAAPKLVLFMQAHWHAGDYQSMRYGLCSAMLDDGYYHIDDGVNSLVDHALDFDEFHADLGHEIQPPQMTPWQKGVYRRDFERGIILVNPRGNGPQTVELGGSYEKLTGAQDPTVNTGEVVSTVTIADRDGLVLVLP